MPNNPSDLNKIVDIILDGDLKKLINKISARLQSVFIIKTPAEAG